MNRREFTKLMSLVALGASIGGRLGTLLDDPRPSLAVGSGGPVLGPVLAWAPAMDAPVEIQEFRGGRWWTLTVLPARASRFVINLDPGRFYTYTFRARHVASGAAPGPWAIAHA